VSDRPERQNGSDGEVLEQLFEELAQGGELEGGAAGREGRLRREYVELLGLVGGGVEPIPPPPAVRERLLARVAGGAAAPPPPATVPSLGSPPSTAPRRWALPLAACLALALAGFAGFQATQLASQRATIEQLSRRLEEVEARTPTVAALRDELAEMRSRLAFVTRRGVEICALRPMAAEARRADSRGILYVAADHQHWYLTIDSLMPCKQGRSYQLWFVPEEGEPVSAGIFDVGEGVRVELSSDTMPAGTRAVTVTLEPSGGSPLPTGPAVLHGDEVMAVL
jgi:hypothetical protein